MDGSEEVDGVVYVTSLIIVAVLSYFAAIYRFCPKPLSRGNVSAVETLHDITAQVCVQPQYGLPKPANEQHCL